MKMISRRDFLKASAVVGATAAMIGYIWYEAPAEEMNFTTLLENINSNISMEL